MNTVMKGGYARFMAKKIHQQPQVAATPSACSTSTDMAPLVESGQESARLYLVGFSTPSRPSVRLRGPRPAGRRAADPRAGAAVHHQVHRLRIGPEASNTTFGRIRPRPRTWATPSRQQRMGMACFGRATSLALTAPPAVPAARLRLRIGLAGDVREPGSAFLYRLPPGGRTHPAQVQTSVERSQAVAGQVEEITVGPGVETCAASAMARPTRSPWSWLKLRITRTARTCSTDFKHSRCSSVTAQLPDHLHWPGPIPTYPAHHQQDRQGGARRTTIAVAKDLLHANGRRPVAIRSDRRSRAARRAAAVAALRSRMSVLRGFDPDFRRSQ